MIYLVVKSLNNNLVLAVDENQEELVLFGKGIGFKKKKDDEIDATLITKIYKSQDFHSDFTSIIEHIPEETFSVTQEIVTQATDYLGVKLNPSILVALSDHIQGALDRQKSKIQLSDTTLQWEIPFLYYKEYEFGKQSLSIIEKELGATLPSLEASFIALHFVNAQDGVNSMNETILITEIIKNMVKIIQQLFDRTLDKESIDYSRFVTHVRYFINRQLHNKAQDSNQDDRLYQIIQENYPKSFAVSLMIKDMLKKQYNIQMVDSEIVYLVIHIDRVVNNAIDLSHN
ncbi:MAG: PRD domain-containing protein [Streptococcaceae bacterium]|jgi:beta-glucoside operon transcriptional antiterminator|nr:PRD domain-containing protein [Streptococcaceae bacterium]